MTGRGTRSPTVVAASPSPHRTERATPAGTHASPSAAASPSLSIRPLPPPIGTPVDVSALAAEVADVRGLTMGDRPLEAYVVSGEALGGRIRSLADDNPDLERIEADRRLLVALRLVGPDVDLRALVTSVFAEQVLGLYIPEEQRLYIRSAGLPISPAAEGTAAHEIVHALQDRAFGIDRLQERPDELADASLAVRSLVEGDAADTTERWSAAHQTDAERRAAAAEVRTGSDVLASAPRYIRQSLYFPYVHGTRYVQALRDAGGTAALDAALRTPPSSTEQVMHPGAAPGPLLPVPVAVPAAPAGWTTSATYEFGEFDVVELFATALGERRATDLGAGWGGGTVRGYTTGTASAVALATAWDTPADAAAVCEALPAWFTAVAGGTAAGDVLRAANDVGVVACDGTQVRLGLAPDEATARAVAAPVSLAHAGPLHADRGGVATTLAAFPLGRTSAHLRARWPSGHAWIAGSSVWRSSTG